jgi:hypothetical protein
MKKKVRKLTINRETLCSLNPMLGVQGGLGPTLSPACMNPTQFGTKCLTATNQSYGDCGPSVNCSNGCATGGTACTGLTCATC